MNDPIQDAINSGAGHYQIIDWLMRFFANDLIFVMALVLVALWLWPVPPPQRSLNQRIAALAGVASLVALLIGAAVGAWHYQPRPFVTDASTRLISAHAGDNGFPSDHALVSFAAAASVVAWRRLIGVVLLALAILIGFARVFVGIHWPSDIAAGAAIGCAAAAALLVLMPIAAHVQAAAARFLPEAIVTAPPD